MSRFANLANKQVLRSLGDPQRHGNRVEVQARISASRQRQAFPSKVSRSLNATGLAASRPDRLAHRPACSVSSARFAGAQGWPERARRLVKNWAPQATWPLSGGGEAGLASLQSYISPEDVLGVWGCNTPKTYSIPAKIPS